MNARSDEHGHADIQALSAGVQIRGSDEALGSDVQARDSDMHVRDGSVRAHDDGGQVRDGVVRGDMHDGGGAIQAHDRDAPAREGTVQPREGAAHARDGGTPAHGGGVHAHGIGMRAPGGGGQMRGGRMQARGGGGPMRGGGGGMQGRGGAMPPRGGIQARGSEPNGGMRARGPELNGGMRGRGSDPNGRGVLAKRPRESQRPPEPRRLSLIPAQNLPGREFQLAAADILQAPPSPIRMRLLVVICLLFALAIGGACIAKIDVYAVAPGRIQAVGRSKVVQPGDPGTVDELLVSNGAHVKAGDLLVVLDATERVADRDQQTRELQQCDAEIARRDAQVVRSEQQLASPNPRIQFKPEIDSALRQREESVLHADLVSLRSELASLDSKIAASTGQIESLRSTMGAERQLMGTLQARLEMREQLAQKQWDTMTNVLDAREALDREKSLLVEHEGQVGQAESAIASLKQDKLASIAKFNDENSRSRATVEGKRDGLLQDVVKMTARADRTRITASVSGVVQDLGVTTVGQVVTAGQQLMTIVPEHAPVEIEALVQNGDIGFVEAGQPAVIKVDTFPFTIYGTLSGHVVNVAHDAVDAQNRSEALPTAESAVQGISADRSAASRTPQTQDLVFPVTLAVDEVSMHAEGRIIPLTPGMTVTVEMKTSQRRVIQYVLSPILRASSEAFHDR